MATQPTVPANVAAALRYGPSTQSALRRSQYLTQALQQMQAEGGQNIQSPLELGAKLLATAILRRQSDKADAAATSALKTDQDNETASLVGALRGFKPQAAQPAPPAAPAQPVQTPQAQPVALPSAQPAPPPVSQLTLNPDIDKLVRTVWGEARGEDPTGQMGVANVIINRSRKSGKPVGDVVLEPNQFEPWSNPKTRAQLEALTPDSADYQQILANIAPALQGQDVTGGADHFYSPTAQAAAGRPPPKWDNGSGVDYGRHRFFNLGYGGQGAHQRQAPADFFQAEAQPLQPPTQVAMNGQIDPAMLQASVPAGPSGGGNAPAAASPSQAAGAPAWPNWTPTPDQINYVESLLRDPRTHDQGVAEARKLQAKMAEPAEAEITNINGVPFYVSKTPGQAGQPVMIPIPQQAMTQTISAQEAGLPFAQQGLYVQKDPFGNLKEAPGAPPQGYNAGPEGYAPVRGGPADPTRPQLPSAGYQYTQSGQQAPIKGGPADPTSGQNLISGEGALRKEYEVQALAPYIAARNGYEKVLSAANDNSGASDIALIFGFMKTLDPTSTVREGEFSTAQNSGSIDQTVQNLYNRVLKGERLTPQQRQQFAATAGSQFGVAQQRFEQANNRYGEISQAYGFAPSRILQTFPSLDRPSNRPPAPNPAIVATPGTRAAAIAEARKRGLIK